MVLLLSRYGVILRFMIKLGLRTSTWRYDRLDVRNCVSGSDQLLKNPWDYSPGIIREEQENFSCLGFYLSVTLSRKAATVLKWKQFIANFKTLSFSSSHLASITTWLFINVGTCWVVGSTPTDSH